jgi:hypothetical protein
MRDSEQARITELRDLVGSMLTHSSAEILQKNQSDTDTLHFIQRVK